MVGVFIICVSLDFQLCGYECTTVLLSPCNHRIEQSLFLWKISRESSQTGIDKSSLLSIKSHYGVWENRNRGINGLAVAESRQKYISSQHGVLYITEILWKAIHECSHQIKFAVSLHAKKCSHNFWSVSNIFSA